MHCVQGLGQLDCLKKFNDLNKTPQSSPAVAPGVAEVEDGAAIGASLVCANRKLAAPLWTHETGS
jgi:hypothetical protein